MYLRPGSIVVGSSSSSTADQNGAGSETLQSLFHSTDDDGVALRWVVGAHRGLEAGASLGGLGGAALQSGSNSSSSSVGTWAALHTPSVPGDAYPPILHAPVSPPSPSASYSHGHAASHVKVKPPLTLSEAPTSPRFHPFHATLAFHTGRRILRIAAHSLPPVPIAKVCLTMMLILACRLKRPSSPE